MIHVIAEIHVVSGQRDRLLAEFRKLVPVVRQEYGCVEYGPTIDAETDGGASLPRPDVVTIVEKWEDLESLRAHLAAPHMAEYRGKVKEIVEETKIHILRPV